MNTSFSLTVVDDVILHNMVNSKEFKEFSNSLDYLDTLFSESLITEKVNDTTPNAGKFFGAVKKNTVDTTKDVVKVYGNVVSGNANVIKATWDLAVKSIGFISKVLKYVLNKVADVPKMILKLGAKISDLSLDLRAKISGNITLHVTAPDIELIYNHHLMRRLVAYVGYASSLSKGDFWSTLTHRRKAESDGKGVKDKIHDLVVSENDIKTCKKMSAEFAHIKNTEFRRTIVDLRDKTNVNIYFGAEKMIKFTDIYGKKYEASYTEALSKIIEDLEAKRSEIETLHQAIGEKLHTTEVNQAYNHLSGHAKYILTNTILEISKVSGIIGNFIKYILLDISTINENLDKIIGIGKGKLANAKEKERSKPTAQK